MRLRCPRAKLGLNWVRKVCLHYGITESGLGDGVEREALDGYHLGETDLYYEIIDPSSGWPLPNGRIWESVSITLTRRALPLILYRA